MSNYFNWTELKAADRFRLAGYDDLFIKLNDYQAKCLGTLAGGKKLARKGEKIRFGDEMTGFIMAIG